MTPRIAVALLVLLPLAGCLGGDEPVETEATPAAPPLPPTHVLAGAIEPEALEAMSFQLLGAVGAGGPAYGAGEPSIWAHLDGTIYLAFPGCDGGLPLGFGGDVTGEACAHGPVYKSTDDGATWTRLNQEGTGRLTDDGPSANGDNDVAVDADGVVYASNLGGGGIQVLSSPDGGESWGHLTDVVPEDHWADRQWMAAAAPGNLIMTWMGGDGDQRAVAISTTFDHGANWTEVEYVGEDIGWLGTVQFDASGERAYIPFTENNGDGTFSLLVARSFDAGATWDVVDTGTTTQPSQNPAFLLNQWSGVLMAPALDVTGDGTVVYVWSEEVPDPSGSTQMGAAVKVVASTDHGDTWSEGITISERATAIMPWATGGAGDRLAITYFANDAPVESDYAAGPWDVMAVSVDGLATGEVDLVRTVLDTNVHQGGLCARGGACLLTGSDRALLDFFESDLLPDGRLVVTYPADPVTGGKYIEIRVAIQDGGSPLLVRP